MGLLSTDSLPTGIALTDAYSAIRTWYCAHADQALARGDEYGRGSAALIQALPAASAVSDLEIVAVLREVILGYLEWAYHQSDGRYKMAAYAHAALEKAGRSYTLTAEETEVLKSSTLWPYLSPHVKR